MQTYVFFFDGTVEGWVPGDAGIVGDGGHFFVRGRVLEKLREKKSDGFRSQQDEAEAPMFARLACDIRE